MAHAQKPDLVFQRNTRFHLNRLLAAEVCGSAGNDCIIFSKYVDRSLKILLQVYSTPMMMVMMMMMMIMMTRQNLQLVETV
jgi:hypothetical protein